MDARRNSNQRGSYRELEKWFNAFGIKPVFIKLRGYSRGNSDYQKAKQPLSKGWSKIENSLSEKEINLHVRQGGWIGLVIPNGFIVVDVDNKEQYQHLHNRLKDRGISHTAISTPNGGQLIFRDTGTVKKQGAKMITVGGIVVDYRIAGKGQIVMPTENTPERYVEHVDQTADDMPLFFRPVRQYNEGDIDSILPIPISEGQRDDTLFRHACRLRNWNVKHLLQLNNGDILRVLQETNQLLCEPPINERTVEEKLRSALSYPAASGDPDRIQPPDPYFIDEDGYLCRWKEKNNTRISIRLSNFNARIIEEISEDNGLEQTHRFVIEGRAKEMILPQVSVSANQFPPMNWVVGAWGNRAILEAGQNTKDLVRHAIQVQSINAEKKTIFTHTGWRNVDGKWTYLTAGGAIGADKIAVKLPRTLERYWLPLSMENEKEAIEASVSFLEIGRHEITYPLYALLWLSPLTTLLIPMPNFSGYCYGDTGTFKTTVCVILLSHFGNFSQIGDLHNFEDTANAIEKKAFLLKDTLLVLDDYHPSYRRQDANQKEQLAQRLIREFSNRTGRERLNPDTSDKGRYAPRGILIITGEELVQLQSTLARVLIIEFLKGDIDRTKLTELQARAERLPHAMASYIRWVRDHLEEIQKTFREKFGTLRERATRENTHKKLPEQVAFLQFGWETMLSWIVDKKILTSAEAKRLSDEGWTIFNALSAKQNRLIDDDEPIRKFFDVLQSLLTQGKVRLEHRENGSTPIGGGVNADLIGYFDENHSYLLPTPSWHAVQRYCIAEENHFPLSKETLYRRLGNKGLIETDAGRHTVPMRIRGKLTRVLKFLGTDMFQKEVTEVTDEEKPQI